MIKYITIIFCLASISCYAQEKNVSTEEMKLKLIECQNSIATINDKISQIERRLSTIPDDQPNSTENRFYLNERLAQLGDQKLSLNKIQHSLQAYLGLPSGEINNRPVIISKSDFEKYPLENQQQILAHPEKYVVE